ncbi:MAG TPA: SRPBCC family protein [Chroococcales cyanobacterium]
MIYLLVGIPLLAAGVLAALASKQPSNYRVTRSLLIAAPPGVVFDKVNNLSRWAEWSPWEKMDPAMKKTFTGPESGDGASYSWVGNASVGEGRMTIAQSEPAKLIKIDLEFLKPFKGTSTAEFAFEDRDGQTLVSWTGYGDLNAVTKVVSIFMSMDKCMGDQFEKGLRQLKQTAEASA